MRLKHLIRGTASLAVLAAMTCGGVAYAQDEEDSTDVGAILVTAQKREQRLQDVPIVVTVAGEQLIEDAGVHDIKDLQILTPGMMVTSTSNESITTARIRGIGTVGDNPGLESSVGVVIDGVYRPRNGVGFGDLGLVERIEVLKGPQGTLFGKNTSAGVINIVTRAPSFEPEAEVELTGGNYGARGGSVWLSGPLVADKVAASLFAATRQRDGFLDVVNLTGPRTLTEDVDQNFWTARGQLAILPNERFTGRVIVDYTKRDENCCLGTQLFVGQQAGNAGLLLTDPLRARSRGLLINDMRPGALDITNTPFDRRAYANRDTTQKVTDKGVSGEFSYDLRPDVTLTSITAARNWELISAQDSDFTAADLLYRPGDGSNGVEFDQFSQELRLGGEHGKLTWQVGAFYADEDLTSNQVLLYGADFYGYWATRVLSNFPALIGLTPATVFQPGNGLRDNHVQNDETLAFFTNNDFKITDRLTATLGLRHTSDDKTLTSTYSTTGSTCDQAEAAYPGIVPAVTPGSGGSVPAARVVAQGLVRGLCVNQMNNDFDALGPVTQTSSEDETSGTFKLSYRWNEDVMTYASYSRGYKAGGFNLDRTGMIIPPPAAPPPDVSPNFTANPNTSFAPETADSYELGIKTQLFNNRLLLNATLFSQKFEDFQLNTFVGTAFIVETLPEVTSKGLDLDFVWYTPVEGLSLQGGVTVTNTKIGAFTAADLSDPTRFASLSRLPGARLSFAPRTSASLAATYERDINSRLTFRGNVSAKTVSAYNTGSDLHPSKAQDAYTLLNARVGIGSPDEHWTLELWGQNLGDEDYVQVGFNGPFQVDEANDNTSVYDAFLGAPRTYGLTLRSKF